EAKAGVDQGRTEIFKSETEQLIHSCEWFKQEYPGRGMRPLIVHPATVLAHEAVFPSDGRVVTQAVLAGFSDAVRSLAVAFAMRPASEITEKLIHEQLQANSLLFDRCWASAKKITP
ncbi:MAG: hypothetical protein KGL75_01125, partial [Acidobacteriota bacterium]|nr:hypothetical protein [Acidobacteriota bacterium]